MRSSRFRAIALVMGLFGCSAAFGGEAVTEEAVWEAILTRLGDQHDKLSGYLEEAQAMLLARARAEAPALVPRLSTPPRRQPSGYGILPELEETGPASALAKERYYSLKHVAGRVRQALRDAMALAAAQSGAPLEPLVEEYERLRARLRSDQKHIAYHAFWQRAVVEQAEFFAGRNRVVALVRELEDQRTQDGSSASIAALESKLQDELTSFKPARGLAAEVGEDGTCVLLVTVFTDIEEEDFLSAFADAVAAAFVHSRAALAKRYAVELELKRISPAELYPEGAPGLGEAIDGEAHLARFPGGALILTTGAKSTHAMQGRYVLLGPSPTTRRTLAHEFGHLLGLSDAYLRGYDGDPGDPFGVVLVEWTGLIDNLMGRPNGGRVSEEMIETLLRSYGKACMLGGAGQPGEL